MYSKDQATVVDRREMLRVKLINLMQEARLIRREETRTHGELRNELREHRVGIVRQAARETHLAYGFIRGRTYAQMEANCEKAKAPDWAAVRKMIGKYGPRNFVYPECFPVLEEKPRTPMSERAGALRKLLTRAA